MFDRDLVRKINSGRCFVLIGAGPSCEIGYPSWYDLAKSTYERLLTNGYVKDKKSYESYLEQKKFAELFRQAEVDIGNRQKLIDCIKALLIPSTKEQGVIYETISKWPFACYLTTNYDNELKSYIDRTGESFSVLRNRKEDFSVIRDGISNLILKLHSDLDHAGEVIVTSADYERFYVSDEGQYFRDKLRQVFEMFDILIIGYNLSDPDINYVLQLAKKTTNPAHPIYLVSSAFNQADERELLERYNIVLLRYENTDGKHSRLRKILSAVNKYIVPRGQAMLRMPAHSPPAEEVQAASALFLFRRLQLIQFGGDISPMILFALSNALESGTSLDKISLSPLKEIFKRNAELVMQNLDDLVKNGLVEPISTNYRVTKLGLTKIKEYQAVGDLEKEQAYGQFVLDMKKLHGGLTKKQETLCRHFAETAILDVFKNRGLSIAKKVFAEQSAVPDELSDIFGCIVRFATCLEGYELRSAFMEAMYVFIVSPNTPQKNYLASISQGYFLFHFLGLDPTFSKLSHDIFQETLWLCDSSVLLPLVAIGCHNHEYSVSLFESLKKVQATLYTTRKLLQEAWEHFKWAVDFVKENGVTSIEFLQVALVKTSYKQNLFIDGYIRLSAEGKVGTFNDYLALVSPKGINQTSFEDNIKLHGIQVIALSELNGFDPALWNEIEDVKTKIQQERESKGTYRSELQIESEAEVWVTIRNLRSGKITLLDRSKKIYRYYFVSQSRVLDVFSSAESITTWPPEAVYRYLYALPETQLNPDLLQQCMLHEYFYAGVSFIDKERYLRYFGPTIDVAKASFEQEKDKYIAEIEESHIKNITKAFEDTPDLEKAFFVAQMGWRLAEEAKKTAEIAEKRAIEAETKVKQLEAEKGGAWKIRVKRRLGHETGRLRNLLDPKHIRKRLKQAKKRRRK